MYFAKQITCFLLILFLNNCLQLNIRSVDKINHKFDGILEENYEYLKTSDKNRVSEFERQKVWLKSKKLKVWAQKQYKQFNCFALNIESEELIWTICHTLAQIKSFNVISRQKSRLLSTPLPQYSLLIKRFDDLLGDDVNIEDIEKSTDNQQNRRDVETDPKIIQTGIFQTLDEKYVNDFWMKNMTAKNFEEIKALNFLRQHNRKASHQCYYTVVSEWNYATNITQENRDQLLKDTKKFNQFLKQESIEAKKLNWTLLDNKIQRLLKKIAFVGTAALEGEDGLLFTKVLNEMQTMFSTAKVCITNKCGLQLDPDLSEIMANSGNYSKLLEVWVKWREASGKQIRDRFIQYYKLGNKAAQLIDLPDQKFKTLLDLWLFQWETPDIRQQMEILSKQLMPFYQRLHAYIRIKLNDAFPDQMPKDKTIPAHLLGNMWAQQWTNVIESVKGVDPYPNTQTIDVTQALRARNYSQKQIYELAEHFYINIGLDPMTDKFWQKSIFEKPDNRTIGCHASAWDFFVGDDYRIKQCSQVNMDGYIKAHHEMGHIQYYMQYKKQPMPFREGANPGFHEAIGDLLSLFVSTPKQLNRIGLLEFNNKTDMNQINLKYLLRMALDRVVFIPFAYIVEKWRSDVFTGKVSAEKMNRHWWLLRGHYQGISPPVKRSEKDFDPGAKYHIANSVEYIRYFVSHILQFQMHKAICGLRQKDVPLYECHIDGNKRTGNILREVLEKGSSEEWPKILERLTGDTAMSVQPLLQYFKPLDDFLKEQLKDEEIGWTYSVDDYFESGVASNYWLKSLTSSILLSAVLTIFILLIKVKIKPNRGYSGF